MMAPAQFALFFQGVLIDNLGNVYTKKEVGMTVWEPPLGQHQQG